MALINTDWTKELRQVKAASSEIVEQQISPMLREAIAQAGDQLSRVVDEAGSRVQENIETLSREIHAQRSLTREDLRELIDYASDKIGSTVDARLLRARQEVSTLFAEKVTELRAEFEDAARRTRRTLYLNLALSAGAALAMAAVGFLYKKVSLGEVDVFTVFRVLLLSLAVGTGLFSALRLLGNWREMSGTRRNIATTVLGMMGIFRPNGALGLLALCVLLLAGWFGLTFYVA
ncbi:MAG: hypothetical protein REI09_10090 [Candidatus Dactylopiibacterium sp.]|nr:hypothetical protein [Candidatus Dactylopiibacterium sp.]